VASKPKSKFRRLADAAASGTLLVPWIERELVTMGEDSWPDEYSIKIVNKEHKFDGYFHPSGHANAPELQLFYEFSPEYQTYHEPLSPSDVMMFQVGSAYHALIQSMLIHMGLTTEEEVEVSFKSEERNCSGALDIRRLTLPNGTIMPIEIKSAGHYPVGDYFFAKYYAQFQVYMDLGDDEPQEQGLMLFLEKSVPHRFHEVLIQRDENMLNQIYSRWARVLEAIEFNDPSMLEYPCHEVDGRAHKECPARFICRLGAPTGEKRPTIRP
jgi:hypothetical protein